MAGVALMAPPHSSAKRGRSTVVLRGRRRTTSQLLSFHVAGVAQTHIHRRFAWPAWHSWHWVARLDWLGRPWRRGTLRGRRGTTSQLLSFHVAGVAQTHIHRRFAWQAWYRWHWVARLDWFGRPWRRDTLRGRRGTTSQLLSFHVAGVAQTHIHRRFAWQAWYRWHWVARLDWLGRLWRRGTLRGRRGTTSQLLSFHVAGVAQTHIHRRFAWQAWYRWHWVARLDWFGRLWRRGTLRGRRGTTSQLLSFCVAGVAQTHIHRRFAWQAWYRWHWVARLDWLGYMPQLWTTLSHTIFDTPSFTHQLCNTPSFTHHFLHSTLSNTIFDTPYFTHHFVTHHLSPHHLPHTIFHHTIFHTQLCHTPSLTHHLSHTTLSHTVFHTQLCHTLSFTQSFHPHHLSPHHPSHTTLSRTIFHHTILHTQLCHTPSFATSSFTHHFVTHHLSHTQLCHMLSFTHNFHTHHLSHTALSHSHTPSFTFHFVTHNCFNFSILHRLLSLSFLPRPCYNLCCSLLEEVDLWGYPVL